MPCQSYCTGEMKHQVTVERGTTSDDDCGRRTTTWIPVDNIFCAIKQKSGSEKFAQDTIRTVKMKSFITRYGVDIVESDRLLFNGQYYNIKTINNVAERDIWLEIDAEQGVVDRGLSDG